MQRIASGTTTEVIPFSASPGLSTAGFSAQRSRGGGALASMTTPTFVDLGSGEYTLLANEDTSISAGKLTEPMRFVISHAGLLEAIHVQVELYVPLVDQIIDSQGSIPLGDGLAYMLAVLAGESTNGGLTFLTPDGVATRVTTTTNPSKERTSVALNAPT